MALAFGGELTREEVHKVNRAMLARETGWTYDYIDDVMDARDVADTLAIFEAVDKAHAWNQQRQANKNRQGRGGRRR